MTSKALFRLQLRPVLDEPQDRGEGARQRSLLFGVLVAAIFLGQGGWTAVEGGSGETIIALGTLESAAISPDGKYVATCGSIGAVLWNAETGEGIRAFTDRRHSAKCVAFSPDGKKILTGGRWDEAARLWSVETGEELQVFSEPHMSKVLSVAFSPNGSRILTGSRDKTARLWDVETGEEIETFSGHTAEVNSVAFSPDGTRVLTGSGDETAKLWSVQTGAEIRTFSGHTSSVTSVALSSDGTKVLTGSYWDKAAKIWDCRTGEEIRTFSGHTGCVRAVAFSPDGTKILTGSGSCNSYGPDNTARLWDVQTGEQICAFWGHTSDLNSVAFSPDGTKILTASSGGVGEYADNTARLWDTETREEIRTFSGHTSWIYAMACSPDGRKVLTGHNDGNARLWDVETARQIRTFSVKTLQGYPVAFSPDGTEILIGGTLFDAITGERIQGYMHQPESSVFSPDGTKILTVNYDDKTAKLRDVETGEEIRTFSGHRDSVSSVTFSPHGSKILTGARDATAALWDAETGKRILTFTGHRSDVTSVAYSPGGSRILTGSTDETAKLWDTETGREVRSFFGHESGVYSVAFSPDGTKILTGSGDNTAKLWNVRTGEEIKTFFGHTFSLTAVTFSPDGTRALTGSLNGSVRVWAISDRPVRTLTPASTPTDTPALPTFTATATPIPTKRPTSTSTLTPTREPEQPGENDAVPTPTGAQSNRIEIDLSPYYNGSLAEDWTQNESFQGNNLSEFPVSRQTLAGVVFDVGGVIQLNGVEIENNCAVEFPDRIPGIKVGAKFNRLHILHGTQWSESEDTRIAVIALNYADGTSSQFEILYGKHVADWWALRPVSSLSGNTVIAWTGQNDAIKGLFPDSNLRIFRTTYENPRPGAVVESIAYLSTMTDSGPFLISATVESGLIDSGDISRTPADTPSLRPTFTHTPTWTPTNTPRSVHPTTSTPTPQQTQTGGEHLGIFQHHVDIDFEGRLGAPGNATYNETSDTYTVKGSGYDIWDEGDSFHFLYKEWTGDFDFRADVTVSGGDSGQEWIKAMLMARQDLTPRSAHIGTRSRRDGQFSTQWRREHGVDAESTAQGLRYTPSGNPYPMRQRFERVGDTFNTYYLNQDGNWVLVDSNNLSLNDLIYLGFAVTADDTGEIATGTFSNVVLVTKDETKPTPGPGQSPPIKQEISVPFQAFSEGVLTCVAYSPNGKQIVTGSGGGWATLWDVETGNVVRRFFGHTRGVSSVAFSADATRLVTGGDDQTAMLWDVQTGTQIRKFSGHTNGICSVSFSPDATRILTGSGGFSSREYTVKLWDVETGEVIRTFAGHTHWVYATAFSPDGTKVLTNSSDETVKLWDVETGMEIQTFSGRHGTHVGFSSDGTAFLTGSILWDSETGKQIGEIVHGSLSTLSCDWTKALTWRGAVVDTSSEEEICKILGDWDPLAVAFSPDGTKLLTGFSDGKTAKLWDVKTGEEIQTFSGHQDGVFSATFSPDGRTVLTANKDAAPDLWDVKTNRIIQTFSNQYMGHEGTVYALGFSPDGTKVLTGSIDGTAKLWDVKTGGLIHTYSASKSWITSVAFSPDGTRILTGSLDKARLWDEETGQVIRTFPVEDADTECSALFSPDGTKILTASDRDETKLWDVETGEMIRYAVGGWGSHECVAFSPDGTNVLVSGYSTATLSNIETGQRIETFSGHQDKLSSVAYSPSGKTVLTGSADRTAKLWDTNTGEELRTFSGHGNVVYSVTFSPDERRVLTGSRDGTSRLWEIDPPRVLIVAGGGEFQGNALIEQTKALAAYAYSVCLARGYEKDDIRWLSAFDEEQDVDGDGISDIYAPATRKTLREAIEWARTDLVSPGRRLLIYMIDHGYPMTDWSGDTDTYFGLNPKQTIPAAELDSWLHELTKGDLDIDVTLVVDSCYSGKFIEKCIPPEGEKRLVISSTTADTEAVMMPPPDLTSFSYVFWGAAYMGATMQEAIKAADGFFREFSSAGQRPQMDDNGDGVFNELDGNEMGQHRFGRSWAYAGHGTGEFPAFEGIYPSDEDFLMVQPGSSVDLSATIVPGSDPLEVWAVIRPPAPEIHAGEAVASDQTFERINLTQNGKTWTGKLENLTEEGVYVVSYTARFQYDRLSRPKIARFRVSDKPNPEETLAIRALLVAGSGDVRPWAQDMVSYALDVCQKRGYRNEDIRILGRDFPTNASEFEDALTRLGVPESADKKLRLFVYLVGDCSQEGEFILAENERLSAADLVSQLNQAQNQHSMLDVILVVDAPYAGKFIEANTDSSNNRRVVIAGTSTKGKGLFAQGISKMSFSKYFLGNAYQGKDLWASYDGAYLSLVDNMGQPEPMLDDDGDGETTKNDGLLAEEWYIGRRGALAGPGAASLPTLLEASEFDDPISGDIHVWVDVLEAAIPEQVWVSVLPKSQTGIHTAALPEIDLQREGDSWRWSATVEESAFGAAKEYVLVFQALYAQDRLSEPLTVSVVYGEAVPTTPAPTPTPVQVPTDTLAETPTLTPPSTRTPIPKLIRWDFEEDSNFEGWELKNVNGGAVIGGVLSGAASTADPIVTLSNLSVEARYINALAFSIRTEKETKCQAYVATRDGLFEHLGNYSLAASGEFNTVVVPFAVNIDSSDAVVLLRIDPTIHKEVFFEIDWIALVASEVATPIPTPTHTSTPIPSPSPLPAPTPSFTPTPVPPKRPTPTTGDLERLLSMSFEGSSLDDAGFVHSPATGFDAASISVGDVPAGPDTDGRGLIIEAQPGQGTLAISTAPVPVGDGAVLLTVSVRADGEGCSAALAALNSPIDGQLGYSNASGADIPVGEWREFVLIYDPPADAVQPGVQVALPEAAAGPVKVYFDNVIVSKLSKYECETIALDVDGSFDGDTSGLLKNVMAENGGASLSFPDASGGKSIVLTLSESNDASNIGIFAGRLQGGFPHLLRASVNARLFDGSGGVSALVITNGNGNVGVFVNNAALAGDEFEQLSIGGRFAAENPTFPVLCVVQNGGPGVQSSVLVDNLTLQRITNGM